MNTLWKQQVPLIAFASFGVNQFPSNLHIPQVFTLHTLYPKKEKNAVRIQFAFCTLYCRTLVAPQTFSREACFHLSSSFCTGEEHSELQRKDMVEVKRLLQEETREKEAVQKSAADLRNMVKRAEAEKTELSRLLQDARQRITGTQLILFEGVP